MYNKVCSCMHFFACLVIGVDDVDEPLEFPTTIIPNLFLPQSWPLFSRRGYGGLLPFWAPRILAGPEACTVTSARMQPDDIPLLPFPCTVPECSLFPFPCLTWYLRLLVPFYRPCRLRCRRCSSKLCAAGIARPWCLRLVFFLGPCLVIYLSIFEKLSNKQNDSGVGYDTYGSVHELINVF